MTSRCLSYKKLVLLTLREHMGSLFFTFSFLWGLCFSSFLVFCVVLYLVCIFFLRPVSSVVTLSLNCPFLIALAIFSNVSFTNNKSYKKKSGNRKSNDNKQSMKMLILSTKNVHSLTTLITPKNVLDNFILFAKIKCRNFC